MSLQQQTPSHSPPGGPTPTDTTPGQGALGLWDAVSIIVGIVVGAGIYQTAPFIFKHTGSPMTAMLAWAAAGVLSLIGALCYAELATTYPRDGGDIVYLNRAFGNWAGFLFGWVQLTVILTGSIGLMAFVFSNYAVRFCQTALDMELGVIAAFAFAGGAVLILTVTNILGVVFGKTVQNVLTLAKMVGLVAIIFAGFYAPKAGGWEQPGMTVGQLEATTFPGFAPSLGVALVLILYTYGGWNDAAFIAAEVRNGKKNITRALVLGILIITVLYLLVNAAYITSLGYPAAQGSAQIAADVLNSGFGKNGVALMCVLVMVSALGAVNGLIFTGARVYAAIGKDYPILSWMSGWSRQQGAPIPALVTQGVLAMGLLFLVGTNEGRGAINKVLELTLLSSKEVEKKGPKGVETVVEKTYLLKPMNWADSYKAELETKAGEKATDLAKGGFDTLLTCTAPIFWGFFLMTGISVFVLRERDKDIERPFEVPFYPELPLIFCLSCGYMLYSSISYALERDWKGGLFLLGVLPLLIGLPLYRFSRLMKRPIPGSLNR
jgi:basic amino acid/polyamine antiporter, APA family